jgi:hypothetical protein
VSHGLTTLMSNYTNVTSLVANHGLTTLMSPLLLQVCCPFSELFLINTINNLYLRCSGRGELYLTRALGGQPMASEGANPRRLVASRGGGRVGDVQSRRPELGGRGVGRQLREAGDVGGRPVERVRWRSGQGRRAAASRSGRVRA